MKILERKKVELHFNDVVVYLRAGIDDNTTYILFTNEDDANKVFGVLNNYQAFDGTYNVVSRKNSTTICVTGEILVKRWDNRFTITVYYDWEEL
jgi:hypothetical protein|nr:MAG TPA: hypothetical protein [Crassvirales sp.]